jgi:muramoyltetrapeptide carboxypeptidase LdcA involved in peptidoglycan recycling
LRGGYGSPRILPFIDYEAVRRNPKPFIGYSDITAPLNALHRLTGLVTFHGPNASENMSPYSLRELKKVLYAPEAAGVIAQADPYTPVEGQVDKENRLRRIAPGKVRGPLVGGNISVLSTLIGTSLCKKLGGATTIAIAPGQAAVIQEIRRIAGLLAGQQKLVLKRTCPQLAERVAAVKDIVHQLSRR